jgi:hypothetical protein
MAAAMAAAGLRPDGADARQASAPPQQHPATPDLQPPAPPAQPATPERHAPDESAETPRGVRGLAHRIFGRNT